MRGSTNLGDMIRLKELSKNNAAKIAAKEFVFDDMVIGIGTGSTVRHFISYLRELIEHNDLNLILVPSSYDTRLELHDLCPFISSLIEYPEIDICFDGADLITSDFNLIKGGGGAMLREKLVASSAREFIVLVDESKYPKKITEHAVPVEIYPEACNSVIKPIFELGGKLSLRHSTKKAGPVISDNGNIIGDIQFSEPFNVREMEKELNNIPGIFENGLFTSFCKKVIIGKSDAVEIIDVESSTTTVRQI